MPAIAKLVVALGASTANFETDMKRAARISDREMRKMEYRAKQLNDKWNRNFKMAGLAVAGGLALATKAAIDFEKAMGEVSTLVDDTSGMDDLAESVKELSVQYGQAPVEQAKALYQVISAGASTAAEQMENLEAANKLAVGGVTDVATAADGLTTVLNAYAGSGLDVTRISDILFNTMKNGKTTIGELASTVGNVATMAAQTGVDFEQLGAAVGTLTKAGINTSQSMDGLRGVLSAVMKQSDQSVKMAEELGIQFDIAALKTKGLHGFLEDIANSGATTEQLSKLFGRVEGLNVVMSLGAENGAEFTRQLESMETAAGATEVAVGKMAEQTAFKVDQAKVAFQTLGIEIGSKFLSTVAGTATTFVKHIDAMAAAIEALVYLLTIRLGVMGVRAMLAATQAAGGMATAMAALGGPVGAIALALGAVLLALKKYQDAVYDSIDTTRVGSEMLLKQAEAYRAVGDAAKLAENAIKVQEKRERILKKIEVIESEILALEEKKSKIWNRTTLQQKVINAEIAALREHLQNAFNLLAGYTGEMEKMGEETETAAGSTALLGSVMELAAKGIEQMAKHMRDHAEAIAKYEKVKIAQRIKNTNKVMQEANEILDELVAENDAYVQSLEDLFDALNPVQAAGEQLGNQLALLTEYAQENAWSTERYEEAVRKLTDAFTEAQSGAKKTVQEFDLLQTAIDEGTRILERSFASMWEGLLSGSKDAFDSIKDGFKSLISNLIHQATTQQITLNIQQGLQGTGSGPGGGINWGQLGTDFAKFASVIIGGQLGGGGEYANMGAAVGSILGSFIPGLGTVIGGAIGSVLGGLIGGLFDKPSKAMLEFAGYNIGGVSGSDRDSSFDSVFGKTYVRRRHVNPEALAEMTSAIQDFDDSIASFLNDDQIDAITDRLKTWSSYVKAETLSLDQFINSRFAAILSTFSVDTQKFVLIGRDLESQIERLQVAVAAENIIAEAPEAFGDATVAEFLDVVESFRSGAETIGEAFQEVIALLDQIIQATGALRAYADSDLGEDFQYLLDSANITLAEAVAGMQASLGEAIAAFDGSPEQLSMIGQMTMSIREGELKLLQQIDDLQKGISASLEQLKADLLGLTAEERTGEDLFNQAGSLVAAVAEATTQAEVAALAEQFEALIREMTPEDQARNTEELLRMIGDFDQAQTDVLEQLKQNALDNAQATRDMVDSFLLNIGTPLEILTASNQAIADGVEQLVETDIEGHQERTEEILDAGVTEIANQVQHIGPAVARAVHSAVAGANFVVNVSVEQSLVTQ